MLKKFFSWSLALMALLLFCGCDKNVGKIYSLEESFELGLIMHEQLQDIANNHNDNKDLSELLPNNITKAIKETAAYELRNSAISPIREAKAKDFVVLKYYGVYNNCYIIMLNNPYSDAPAEIVDEWAEIDGVLIHYKSFNKIKVWKEN